MKIAGVKGMPDILPDEIGIWQRVEDTIRARLAVYGYAEVRTPIVEETRLFARSIGEATDIVGKEMYTFEDRKGKGLALRPEGTAGAVRAYVQHSVHVKDPVAKWWYRGPMYRYERVQAGRYRQFHQIGAEVFGIAEPALDAELLAMLDQLFRRDLGVTDLVLYLNTLGDPGTRPAYIAALKAHLGEHLPELCEDCRRRYDANPLRTLDCKVPGCQPILDAAPPITDWISDDARAHFETVQTLLRDLEVPFEVRPRLVRGLDYYNRTTFELVAGGLGAQNTVCAGGRYDSLVKTLGGPDVPALGFALGLERLVQIVPRTDADAAPRPDVFFVSIGDEAFRAAFRLTQRLRSAGLLAELDLRGGSVKSQMRRADKMRSRYAVVLGESELASGRVRMKDLTTSEAGEVEVALDDLESQLRQRVEGTR